MGLIIDSFAGGGGASTGIEMALGRSPDIAVNHDPEAVSMHARNHPRTRHLCGDVWDVDPVSACDGKPVDLAWFSPDCTFHSKARGGKPFRDRRGAVKRRALAWVVVRWAKAVRPRVIILENVEEFADWGPLGNDGKPCPRRRGFTFRRWVVQLENHGYRVEMRELRACDYGAPTTRKRLFVIARCDGRPIAWPEPTHGLGRARPWRTAAECIDWSIPCPSIFDRARPLAENTLRRIARGIKRFVIDSAKPFIVGLAHQDDRPGGRAHGMNEPIRTIHAGGGNFALVSPTLVQTGYGERAGQAPRSLDIHKPLGTIVAQGQKHALVAAFLAKHNGGHEATGSKLGDPIHTITTQDHHSLVTSNLVKLRGSCADGQRVDAPAPTITAGGTHIGEVRAFLTKFYGNGTGQPLQLSLDTITTRDRFGLVMVHGEPYQIADIGMRMLQPHELFKAQGFPEGYVIDRGARGEVFTKKAQIRLCGNSVCPPIAAALVRANVGELTVREVA